MLVVISIVSSLYIKPAALDEEKCQLQEALMARLDYWHTMLPALGSRKLTVKLQEATGWAESWCAA